MMRKIFEVTFSCFVTIVFLITGAAKLISTIYGGDLIRYVDPILGVPNWLIFVTIGTAELVIAITILQKKLRSLSVALAMGLSMGFLFYRSLFVVGEYTYGCPCLGRFTDWLSVDSQVLGILLVLVSSMIFVGGSIFFAQKAAQN